MDEAVKGNKFSWGAITGGLVTLITLVGGVIGIWTGVIPILQARNKIDGVWTLKTQTKITTYKKFEGMELTYTVNLNQDGTHITGKGEKVGEKMIGESYVAYEPNPHYS